MSVLRINATAIHDKDTARPLLLGSSESMRHLLGEIRTAARSDAKVLITGETGVGKEVVARLIHADGSRNPHNFLAINCAGLPDDLLESELFGHVKGSFTGAYRDKPGLAALAHRGTLFLDELGEMSPRMQGLLLRFLETGEIHRVGSDHFEQRVDVRVIAATNRNLSERIAAGAFRGDLYYRLNVIPVTIPPLRTRGSDILTLFGHYLERFCATEGRDVPEVTPETRAALLAYAWPGNVRELKNVAERLAVRHNGPTVDLLALPVEIRGGGVRSVLAAPVQPTLTREPAGRWIAADTAWDDMVRGRRTFWSIVHPRFMNRELTKADVREIVRRGLEQTGGSYRKLIELFLLPPSDYKRFLAFLTQHDCHLKFHDFRGSARAGGAERPPHSLGAK